MAIWFLTTPLDLDGAFAAETTACPKRSRA